MLIINSLQMHVHHLNSPLHSTQNKGKPARNITFMTVERNILLRNTQMMKKKKIALMSDPGIHGHDGAEIHGVHVLIGSSHYLFHNQSVSLL